MMKFITLFLIIIAFSTHSSAFYQPSQCNDPNSADSYVLALSSQAGFCETYGFEAGRPECLHLTKDSYAATHLTLHGLWPNKDLCGTYYGYCGWSRRRIIVPMPHYY